MQSHLAERLEQVSPALVSNERKALASLFSFLHQEGLWPTNPLNGVGHVRVRYREHLCPDIEDVLRVMGAGCARRKEAEKLRILVLLLATTGLRITEAARSATSRNGAFRAALTGHEIRISIVVPRIVEVRTEMLKNIKLERPLAFIDVETTGKNPYSDRVVELSILKIQPDSSEEYKSHRVNPETPIPAEATAVHGITDADVAGEPALRQYAKSIRDFLDGCDIAGFNIIRFDLPCLEAELDRSGVDFSRQGRYLVDCMVIYHLREPRNLEAAYRKYCGGEMENAHCAEEDAKACAEVLDGQLDAYEDLPREVSALCELCYTVGDNFIDREGKFVWVDGEAVCNFGKHKGRRLKDIAEQAPDYLDWICRQDFSADARDIAAKALDGEFPQMP